MIDYGYNMIGVYGNLISTNVKLNQRVEKGKNEVFGYQQMENLTYIMK